MPETVLLNQPRVTNQPPMGGQQGGWQTGQPQQPFPMQPPKKSSKTWIWVVGILALVVLFCGGGLVGLLIWAGNQPDIVSNTSTSPTPSKSNSPFSSKSPTNGSPNTTNSSPSDRKNVEDLDLATWVNPNSTTGNTDFTDGELFMSSRMPGYYYALAGLEDQKSVNADSTVTVRALESKDTTLGYGLIFHSQTRPLQQGYALLIDAKKGRYRIVHHTPGKESPVINWTRSDAIITGTGPNKLEVRDNSGSIDIYINDKQVNTIKNEFGYSDGVIGLYAGDAIKLAFSKLQIRR